MVAVLGVAHLVISLLSFVQQSSQHEARMREEMEERPRAFDALLIQAGQSLGELALQIAFGLSKTPESPLAADLAQTESFGSLISVELFDSQGNSFAAWDAPGSARPIHTPQYPAAVAYVLASMSPTTLVSCHVDCALYAFVPFFDQSGTSRIVAVGQPLTDTLLAFQRLDGADVGILKAAGLRAPAATRQHLEVWGRELLAITNAPDLMPILSRLRLARHDGATEMIKAQAGSRDFRLFRAPLPRASDPDSELFFLLDESSTLAAIRRQSLNHLAMNALTLALSAVAVYLLLTPALRRLHDVTTALPLLAERRFDESRDYVQVHDSRLRRDEIDTLREATLALSYRLEALDHAEAASAEKSRFLATMSHEIRTPMNGILGLLELLETGDLSADQRDTVRIARSSGRTLLGVIDDILDFSRVEAAQIVIEAIAFNLGEVLEGATDTLGPTARSKGLRLSVFVDPTLPEYVVGDPHRLRQILFNLCSNAIKFTSTGSVHVRASPVAGAVSGAQRVQFHVIDTGIGLPPEARALLFKPFSQADSATTRRFGGTGLGLSIVRGLVTRMGGIVDYASQPGRGSDFWFELDFPIAETPPGSEPWPSLSGLKVHVSLPDVLEASDLESYLQAAGASFRDGDNSLTLSESSVHEQAHARLEILRDDRVVGSLWRPVRRGELLRRLRESAGLDTPASKARNRPASASDHSGTEGPWVLVAEDHAVNQQVIRRQLTQLGYRPVIANDGVEALARLHEQSFAILLADLHMPKMDGLQLAQSVRAAEAQAGAAQRRLPIIALTAAALSGERERCRDAGMDGFLLKPAGLDRLREVLAQFAPFPSAATPVSAPDSTPDTAAPIDLEALLDMVGGDAAFAEELLREFLRINQPFMATLDQQLQLPWDGPAVREKAHRLLGSARTLAAKQLAEVLMLLETAAIKNHSAEALKLWPRAQAEFESVRSFVARRSGSDIS